MPAAFVTAGDVATAAEHNLLPRGVVARAVVATNSAANAGTTGVLSATTFTAVADRRYKISIMWGGTIQVDAGASEVQIRRGATSLITSARNAAAGTEPGGVLFTTDVPGAGSVTYNLYTFTTATTVQLQSNYEILVEDIGAS